MLQLGPASYADLRGELDSPGVLRRFLQYGLIEADYQVQHPRGGAPRTYYKLTAAGWELANDPEWASARRAGECCEAAILGIEGDHDPYPVCTGARGVPMEASGGRED